MIGQWIATCGIVGTALFLLALVLSDAVRGEGDVAEGVVAATGILGFLLLMGCVPAALIAAVWGAL